MDVWAAEAMHSCRDALDSSHCCTLLQYSLGAVLLGGEHAIFSLQGQTLPPALQSVRICNVHPMITLQCMVSMAARFWILYYNCKHNATGRWTEDLHTFQLRHMLGYILWGLLLQQSNAASVSSEAAGHAGCLHKHFPGIYAKTAQCRQVQWI